jgi:hypothetical protein
MSTPERFQFKSDDPVGQRLEGVRLLIDRYRSAGLTSIAQDLLRRSTLLPTGNELADDVVEFVMRSDPELIGSVIANARQCAVL